MTDQFTEEIRKNLEEEYGSILGRKTKNAKLYRHTGNWAYQPAMFFCANIKDAVETATNIDATLLVYDEAAEPGSDPWKVVYEIDLLYSQNEADSRELLDILLKNLGLTRNIFKGGQVRDSFYRYWTRESIPGEAFEIAPGSGFFTSW